MIKLMVEMVRIDIVCEIYMISFVVVMPREGQLQKLFTIFAYLKLHHSLIIIMDPTYPDIDKNIFLMRDWK